MTPIAGVATCWVGLRGLHVVGVERDPGGVQGTVESSAMVMGCPSCGVASSQGRRAVRLVDIPCLGAPTVEGWHKRTWSCREASCPVSG